MSKKKKQILKTCCFEWYDKKTKSLKPCGKLAVYIYQGRYPLCEDCKNSATNNTAIEVIK